MTIELKVPALPESVTDATLVAWHKKPGEAVARDENLVDLETDKVVLEVPSPSSGTLAEVRVEDGATVTAGDLLAVLEEGAAAEPEAAPAAAAPVEEAPVEAADTSAAAAAAAPKLSPAVRRLLDEHDLDATIIVGSGKDGRITKSDVMAYLKSHSDENVTPGDPAPELEAAAMPGVGGSSTVAAPVSKSRRAIWLPANEA